MSSQGGSFRALLWLSVLAVFGAVTGYLAGLSLSSIYMSGSGSLFIAAQLLKTFGYSNASSVIFGQGSQLFYSAQIVPYLMSSMGALIGLAVGYFKGKNEDKESVKTQ